MAGNQTVAVSGNSLQGQRQHLKCVVLTPVGPGHESLAEEAKASVEAACRNSCGPFAEVTFVPLLDLDGAKGRSSRRNDGINYALALGFDWIFFLDADDLMERNAFEAVAPYINDFNAIFGLIAEIHVGASSQAVLRPNQLATTTSFSDILRYDPSLTLQMGHFVRTKTAAAIRFDATMDAGEDFKYYLDLWHQYRCTKISRVLFINRRGSHSSGPRSADGEMWRKAVSGAFAEHCLRRPSDIIFPWEGKTVRFALGNPMDLIHRYFMASQFFETEELAYLRQIVPEHSTILEVGANVGNHVVYYGLFMNPEKIIPIEPNPAAIALLKKNIELNHIVTVDESLLGFGIGDTCGHFDLSIEDSANMGTARLIASETGRVEVFPIDAKYRDKVDFIKIDVEGMEMEALRGAKQLIDTFRPIIYIEIMNANLDAFQRWTEENKYKIVRIFPYVFAKNFAVVPETHPLAGNLSQ